MDKATPTPSPASVDSAPPLRFRFIEFNARHAMRGAEAARVAVIDGDDEYWLWMSQRDIAKNMMLHGRCEELLKAHDAYTENIPVVQAVQAVEIFHVVSARTPEKSEPAL